MRSFRNKYPAFCVMNIGCMDYNRQQTTQHLHYDVPFPAFRFSHRQFHPPHLPLLFSHSGNQWSRSLDSPCARHLFASFLQDAPYFIPQPADSDLAVKTVYYWIWWKVLRQLPPFTPWIHQMQYRICQFIPFHISIFALTRNLCNIYFSNKAVVVISCQNILQTHLTAGAAHIIYSLATHFLHLFLLLCRFFIHPFCVSLLTKS